MIEKVLRKLFGKKFVIYTHEEFEEMMKPYRFTMKVARNLGGLEEELHISDDADQIILRTLKEACAFYDADWAGFLLVDFEMKVWFPYRWHNTSSFDRTKELMEEFESLECMKQWIKAMDENQPICIPDVSVLQNTSPDEYEMYRKLHADSVMAVPVFPRPTGFLVIRNPRKHISPDETLMLRMIAYVMLTNINDLTSTEKLKRAHMPKNIKDTNDVIINMFGELEINTAYGSMNEESLASPAVVRLIVFLYLNKGKKFPARTLVNKVFADRAERDVEKDIGNLRTQICRCRQLLDSISAKDLIMSASSGYCFSNKFDITTDVELFDAYIKQARNSVSTLDKIEFLKQAVELYRGDLLSSAYGEHWISADIHHYHLKYISAVNTLLENLAANEAYLQVQQYAEMSLKISEGNPKAYYWLIIAYNRLGSSELAEVILKKAESAMVDEDYIKLKEKLDSEGEI